MVDDEDVAYAHQTIRHAVWSGFEDDEAIAMVIDDLLLEIPEHDRAALRAYADAEVAAKVAAEATWSRVTDCDRLEAAFSALAKDGILALHNAGYTMTDGHAEAAEALEDAAPGTFFGYCFYHGQDVEGVIDGGPLYVAFDHVEGEVPDRLKVGRIVDAALHAAGFTTQWSGETSQRIAIPGFRWQRRASLA